MIKEIRSQKNWRMKLIAFLFCCVCQLAAWLGCEIESGVDDNDPS